MIRSLSAVAAILSTFAFAAPSFAQDAQVTTTLPAAPAGPSAATVVVAPAAAAPVAEKKEKKEEQRDTTHFRFGLGLDANYLLSPGNEGLQGLGIGVQLRLGAQINQWMAAYYQAHGVLGGTLSDSGMLNGAGTGLIGTVFNSAVFEGTLPVLHVGAGPSVDVIGVKGLMTGSTTVRFGLEGRAAIVIGGHGPGRHGGFAINFNVHPTFWEGTVLTTFSAGIGGEMY
jgi:hypothetical protein